MSLRIVSRLTGLLIGIVAGLLAAPTGLAIYDGQPRTALAYAAAMVLAIVLAATLRILGRHASEEIHRKDALGVVALTWLGLGLVGGLPFVIEGSIANPAAALFEAVSGFTTTGATVVSDVDGLSRATNLWRCLMHWIGGMGIVVLFVAVFPQLGVGAKHLFRSEVPGPITEGLRPKIKQTAMALWWIYGGLTLLAAVLLLGAGMPLYDAVCHAMSTLATGGFATRSASIGAYESATIHWIVIVFMLIAGMNFGLYYGLLRGRWRDFWRNFELRFYLAVNFVVISLVTASILVRQETWFDAVRHATFQTLAVTTTTGFMTEDFDAYPNVARFALFCCMFMGGCAGSTAGGLKASRVYIMLKLVALEMAALLKPHAVGTVRAGRTSIGSDVARGITTFFVAYMVLFAVTSFCLVALDLDLLSAMSATVACLSSVGPGLADVGPSQNFGFIPAPGKILLCLCMIAGRLEIFALFAIFSRETWRK
jgi:trk system potassium uptake protein TrkH